MIPIAVAITSGVRVIAQPINTMTVAAAGSSEAETRDQVPSLQEGNRS
jgi:hypothetical protein